MTSLAQLACNVFGKGRLRHPHKSGDTVCNPVQWCQHGPSEVVRYASYLALVKFALALYLPSSDVLLITQTV